MDEICTDTQAGRDAAARLGMMGLQHTPPRLPGEVLVCCSARAHEGRAPP